MWNNEVAVRASPVCKCISFIGSVDSNLLAAALPTTTTARLRRAKIGCRRRRMMIRHVFPSMKTTFAVSLVVAPRIVILRALRVISTRTFDRFKIHKSICAKNTIKNFFNIVIVGRRVKK